MRRGIPWLRLHNNYIQLGHGQLQRRLHQRFTDRTPAIASQLATYKHATSAMLVAAGIPVARNGLALEIEQAVEIAQGLGYPVVLKPAARDRGIGVQLNVTNASAVRRLYSTVREFGVVLVEKQEQGADHRLLVFDGKLAAAARRVPATIVGDGRQTVAALIAQMNADPRRGVGHSNILEKINIDDDVLRLLGQSGLSLTSIPAAGRPVALRLTANLSTGGTSEDVTGIIHPDNRRMAERAARIMNLDIAGIDFICRDISRSYLEVGGAICEINPTPGFRPHLAAPGSPNVVELMVEALFPKPSEGRIPTALITGTHGKTTTAQMVAAILSDTGHVTGLATTDEVSVAGARIAEGDFSVPQGAQMLLRDPSVSAAVLETTRDGMAKFGLGIDQCSVGAVLNIGTDLGNDGNASTAELSLADGLVVKAARDAVVLNADDALCLALRSDFQGRQLILASLDEANPEIRRHLVGGGIVVVVQASGSGREVILKRNAASIFRMAVKDLPAADQGAAEFNIRNAMFAIAIAASLGARAENIRRGLRGFRPDAAAHEKKGGDPQGGAPRNSVETR
jgi:cyanophycin synthetase